MKKTILFISLVVSGLLLNAQSGFNFKGLVADGSGNPLGNSVVNVKIAIHQGNTLRWKEEHAGVNTDAYGIFSVVIGTGTKLGGTAATFDDIDWSPNNMKYSVAVDSGSGYQNLINLEPLESVPFAKMADKIRGVQDAVYVGASSNRKLQVTGDATSTELVEFKVNNVASSLDVLQLVLPAGATTGDFIESRLGNHKVFGINYEGAVFIDGGIKMNKNIRLYTGKVKRGNTNNADFLPVAWGTVTSAGNIDGNKKSQNFTVTKTGTGVYEITINGITNYDEVTVVASGGINNSIGNVRAYTTSSKIYVKVVNSSGNSMNGSFSFVAFKR